MFLVSLPLRAEAIVRSINIEGNEKLSNRELLSVIVLQPLFNFSHTQLQRDLERILDLYHQHGYYFASVRIDALSYSSDSSAVDVLLSVAEGEESRVGNLQLEGNTFFTTDHIVDQFDTEPGKVFDPFILEQDIEDLLRRYEQNGYPFAKATVAHITPQRDSMSVSLVIEIRLDEGMFIQINEIQVEGNTDTKAEVILRETRFRTGEPYNHEKVRTIPQRLNRLNIFSRVSEPELTVTPAGGGLLIKVQEGPTNTFDGVVGYVPGTRSEGGFFTGRVTVGMRNLFGTGRKMNVHWQREDRLSQELALRYVEPWVFDFPVNLGGSFFQRQQDTTYVRRVIEFKADVLATENLSFGALYSYENVIPSSTVGVQAVVTSSVNTGGVEVQYDSRDDIFSPTSGIFYRSDYRIGRKSYLSGTSSVQKISLDFEWFAETFSRQVLTVSLHGKELKSGQIEISDLYRFGGANTMRGYRENQFLGSRVVWSNTEYRFVLARRSSVFGFFDTGYYFRPDDEAKGILSTQRVKYGYGVGMRLETTLGNIGVSFALGEGDSFNQAKIHVGLVGEF